MRVVFACALAMSDILAGASVLHNIARDHLPVLFIARGMMLVHAFARWLLLRF